MVVATSLIARSRSLAMLSTISPGVCVLAPVMIGSAIGVLRVPAGRCRCN